MQNLINALTNATQSFKQEYIAKTKEYANNYYNVCVQRKNWKEVDWCKYFGIEPAMANPGTSMQFLTFPKGFHNTKNSRTYNQLRKEIFNVLQLGLEKYTIKEVKYAELHYISSIDKLAYRLVKKGVNENEHFSITSGRVGVNFECVIKHNYINDVPTKFTKAFTKAFTIIASGPIQQPHYRYLIK